MGYYAVPSSSVVGYVTAPPLTCASQIMRAVCPRHNRPIMFNAVIASLGAGGGRGVTNGCAGLSPVMAQPLHRFSGPALHGRKLMFSVRVRGKGWLNIARSASVRLSPLPTKGVPAVAGPHGGRFRSAPPPASWPSSRLEATERTNCGSRFFVPVRSAPGASDRSLRSLRAVDMVCFSVIVSCCKTYANIWRTAIYAIPLSCY